MKYNIFNIDGKIIKKDDNILIKEKVTNNVTIQSVTLYNSKHTSRYAFQQDSIYFFADGKGVIELENDILYHVSRNDIIFVNKSNSHKVINTGDIHLRYIILKETK